MMLRVRALAPTAAAAGPPHFGRGVLGQDIKVELCDGPHIIELKRLTGLTIHCDGRSSPLQVTLRLEGVELKLEADLPQGEAANALFAASVLSEDAQR